MSSFFYYEKPPKSYRAKRHIKNIRNSWKQNVCRVANGGGQKSEYKSIKDRNQIW